MADADAAKEPTIDWAPTLDVAQHVHSMGLSWMEAQHQAVLAANERASVTAGILIAACVAAVGAAFGQQDPALQWTAALVAVILFTASCCCSYVLVPREYFYPGNHPSSWTQESHKDFRNSLMQECDQI